MKLQTSETPMVSVIMPSYNAAETISSSIQSVLDQSLTNLELIIIDDGSTDNTVEQVSLIKDSRLRIIKLERNLGVAEARNIGLNEASGHWIQFLDADDYIYPDKLESQITVGGKADIVLSDCLHVYPDGKKIQFDSLAKTGHLLLTDLIKTNPILIHAPIVRRDFISHDNRFDGSYCHEDWAFWFHLSSVRPRLIYLKGVKCIYYRREGSRSFDLNENLRGQIECLERFKERDYCQGQALQQLFSQSISRIKFRLIQRLFESGKLIDGDRYLELYSESFTEHELFVLNKKRQVDST